ncbi:hypothetical protein DRE_05451 [Drechslerella stenobrocha 248]|uniref:Frequency clock protein n=1 Tax=Drechslerella stenobrocha 248 TaxID=1043628 RepID=W7I082_9PEZI|nr:hypothetical protein DRE_05451 [Drechslerella stenobrocha 248]
MPVAPARPASKLRRSHSSTSPRSPSLLRHGHDPSPNPPPSTSPSPPRPVATPRHAERQPQQHQQQPQPARRLQRESPFNSASSGNGGAPDDWFEIWDANVGDFNQPNPADGDSPYYLPSEQQRRHQPPRIDPATILATRSLDQPRSAPSMLPTQDSDDESQVYRSVIDDLTIKNKKLKKKLRKMERLHCNNLNEEKLFEIRCYGLPPSRQQELQELLQSFAAGQGSRGRSEPNRLDTTPLTTSLWPSPAQNTDSAYGTRIASLDGRSVLASKAAKSMATVPGKPKVAAVPTDSESPPLHSSTERAKMRMVVRRLEQLFTGSTALQSDLAKSNAQQMVAFAAAEEKLASMVDETAESGDEDDHRGASIMSRQQDHDLSQMPHRRNVSHGVHDGDKSHQRPTRPVDLDPKRAQVAADNVEYLEQMTHSSSHKTHRQTAAVSDGTGWVYLNLIINMAQIYNLNLSLPFIKRSIRMFSDKLELSPDMNKVRWRGGLTGTRMSSSGNSSGNSSPDNETSSGLKSRGDTTTPEDHPGAIKATSPRHVQHSLPPAPVVQPVSDVYSTRDTFQYQPLLFHSPGMHKSSSEDSPEDGSEATNSGSESESESDAGGLPPIFNAGANLNIGDIRRSAPLDGPVIFFKGAPFYTDLSAQMVLQEGGLQFVSSGQGKNYNRFVQDPIGAVPLEAEEEPQRSLRQPNWSSQDVEMNMDDDEHHDSGFLDFPPLLSAAAEEALPPAIPFEASGLGGVRPEDNFVIHIKTQQVPVCRPPPAPPPPAPPPHGQFHTLAPLVSSMATSRHAAMGTPAAYATEVTEARQVHLPPSKLPDASFSYAPNFILSETSSGLQSQLTTPDEPQSQSLSGDSRFSLLFSSPGIGEQSPMDLDALEGASSDRIVAAEGAVAPTPAGRESSSGSGSGSGSKSVSGEASPILRSLDDMDIGAADALG